MEEADEEGINWEDLKRLGALLGGGLLWGGVGLVLINATKTPSEMFGFSGYVSNPSAVHNEKYPPGTVPMISAILTGASIHVDGFGFTHNQNVSIWTSQVTPLSPQGTPFSKLTVVQADTNGSMFYDITSLVLVAPHQFRIVTTIYAVDETTGNKSNQVSV